MIGDNGFGMLMQLVVGAAVLFGLAAGGTWLLVGEKRPRRMDERSEDRGALSEELWGDEGGAGEITHRKAA
jgi:hypothetical protein